VGTFAAGAVVAVVPSTGAVSLGTAGPVVAVVRIWVCRLIPSGGSGTRAVAAASTGPDGTVAAVGAPSDVSGVTVTAVGDVAVVLAGRT
jgi:hypothetical protein